MSQYPQICLDIAEHDWIRWHIPEQSAEYARIINVSDAVNSLRSPYKLRSSYQDTRIQNIVKHLRWTVNAGAGAQKKFFRAVEEGGMKLGHFNKHFVKNTRKMASQGNILEFFLLVTLETTFWMENLIQRWTQSGFLFPKSGHFFRFLKKQGRPLLPPPPLVARLWVWLNMHQYPSICLNILEKMLE